MFNMELGLGYVDGADALDGAHFSGSYLRLPEFGNGDAAHNKDHQQDAGEP